MYEFKERVTFIALVAPASSGTGERVKATPAWGRGMGGLILSILVFGDFCEIGAQFQRSRVGMRHRGTCRSRHRG